MPKYTIGCYTVTHNPNLEWLKEAKESAQGLFDQYVLVDDGSDIPVEGADYRFEKNVGVVEARNKAISLLSTDWIAMIDDDDILIRENVESLKQLLPSLSVDIVSSPVEFFGDIQGLWATHPVMSDIVERNQIPAGSWFKKRVWELLKFKQYPAEDWDFWARAWKHNFGFAHVSSPIYKHRVRSGSLSRDWTGEKLRQIQRQIYANYQSQ